MNHSSDADFDFQRMISKILKEVPFSHADQAREGVADVSEQSEKGYGSEVVVSTSTRLVGAELVREIAARRVDFLLTHIVPSKFLLYEALEERENAFKSWKEIRDSYEGREFLGANPYYLTKLDRMVYAEWRSRRSRRKY